MSHQKREKGKRAPNGASTIYFSEYHNCWVGRVIVGKQDNGKPDRRTVKRHTEAEVIREVRKLERLRDDGNVTKAGQKWTVETWLVYWLENIIVPSIRHKSAERYRTDVYQYLIPGLGAHKLSGSQKLEAEHIEKLYAKLRARKPALSSSSIYHVHATLRAALNEAKRRKHVTENPVLIARAPQLVEPEIIPFTVEEAQRILDCAENRRNGARFALALSVGLRQGEAIGLKWTDIDWVHGCPDSDACRNTRQPVDCPVRKVRAGTVTVRRALQRQTWRHGCSDPHACGEKYHKIKPCREGCKAHKRACPALCPPGCTSHARNCPQREGGGLVVVDTKSEAGRRIVSLPKPILDALEHHQAEQDAERKQAGELWQDGGWIFAQPNGKPIDPRQDYQEWRNLLTTANVRPARLHDARHTAATMLLVLKVPVRAAMDVLGWSDAKIANRYMHVPDQLKHEIADQVAGLLWSASASDKAEEPNPSEDERSELTEDQRAAIRLISSALPPYWQRRIMDLLDDHGDGSAGPAVAA